VNPPQQHDPSAFKSCCADFYADDAVRLLLGDSFHPGGEALTETLLRQVELGPEHLLLDVACGQGTSSLLAAERFGCRVVGLDLSAANLERARAKAAECGLGDRFEARQADAERLPFEPGTFDVVLCECAFCTFPDKTRAADEMARVLKPGGRLALSDMTVDQVRFPPDLNTLLMRVACIADARLGEAYSEGFAAAGFGDLCLRDANWALAEMVDQIKKRLLSFELMSKLGKLELAGIDLGSIDLGEGKRMLSRCREIIEQGIAGYATLTGVREA
jgi:arsenite methyltransferase